MTARTFFPRLSQREKGLLYIGGFVVALSLFFAYIGVPKVQEFVNSRDRVNVLESRLASSQGRGTTSEKLRAEIRGWEQAGVRLKQSPPGETTVMAAGSVVKLAQSSGCMLKEAVPQKPEIVGGAVAVPVKFQFEAGIEGVGRFIRAVEENSPPMVFRSIGIVPAKGSALKITGQVECYTGEGGAAGGN